MKKTRMVFGCSQYHGKSKKELKKARRYARFIAICGYSPVMPQMFFPQFLDRRNPDEKTKSFELSLVQMRQCDEMWIFGTHINKEMKYEIEKAAEMEMTVRLFDDECKLINPETLPVDERVSREFCRLVANLKFI